MSVYSRALQPLMKWLENHLEEFLPAQRGPALSFRDIKAFGELVLILHTPALLSRGTPATLPSVWAEALAPRLAGHADLLSCHLESEAFTACDPTDPVLASALAIVVLSERMGSRRVAHHARTRKLLRRCRATVDDTIARTLPVEVAQAFEMAGITRAEAPVSDYLARALQECTTHSEHASSTLYHVCHGVFFATHYGHRPMGLEMGDRGRLAAVLHTGVSRRLDVMDYDLSAELILAAFWAGLGCAPEVRNAAGKLAAVIASEGIVPIYRNGVRKRTPDFRGQYHSVLVALGALSEGARVGSQTENTQPPRTAINHQGTAEVDVRRLDRSPRPGTGSLFQSVSGCEAGF